MDSKERVDEDGYIFARGRAATSRLNYQYYVWQHAVGFHLHPSIPSLPEDAYIADVATGSGIWLLDLSEKLPPTNHLDGLDISLHQVPPKAWLPSNVNFATWDFFSEPPSDLVGKYDVVHLRLIAVVVKNNDPTEIVKNLALLLKPGGYLQWDELDTPTAHVASIKSDLEIEGVEGLRGLLTESMRGPKNEVIIGSRDWIQQIPTTLAANGFRNAKKYDYLEAPYMAPFWNDVWALSAQEFADMMFKSGYEERGKQVSHIVAKATEESTHGVAVRYTKSTFVAQREGLL